MRIVKSILKRTRPLRRSDPIFGSMLYMGDRSRYWEGQAPFEPTGSTIEVFVGGSADDCFDTQHANFQQIVKKWPHLSDAIGRFLIDELQVYDGFPLRGLVEKSSDREGTKSTDTLRAALKVSSLSIPDAPIENADWDISFEADVDSNHLYTVQMAGLAPQRLDIDG